MTEPSDENYNIIEVSDLRLARLARPEVALSRIVRTDFRDLNTSREPSCFVAVLRRVTINGGCWIPLGHFKGVTWSFSPTSSILQLQDKVQDQQLAEPAPAAYFCVQKHDLIQVEQLPWGGSSTSPFQTHATNIARSLSLRSFNSNDSGYLSENAHPVSKNLYYISEDNWREKSQQDLACKMGGTHLLKIATMHSYCALMVPKALDIHLATHILFPRTCCYIWRDELTEFGLFNGAKCESTSDLVNSFPFFALGILYSKPASSETLPAITDFIVAVSLANFSLWAIFDAWDEGWIEAEGGDKTDWIGEEHHETPWKPFWSSTWATLPGFGGRLWMTKLANSVYTHVFASSFNRAD